MWQIYGFKCLKEFRWNKKIIRKNEVFYIGVTKNLYDRLNHHWNGKQKTEIYRALRANEGKYEYVKFGITIDKNDLKIDTKKRAHILEIALIKMYLPELNIKGKK